MGPPSVRASEFFRTAPTGFQVSPVGKPGAMSIIILQKLAALRSDLRGKKIAISLSPTWFLTTGINPYLYEGNFSLVAASEMTFGGALDFQLKRDVASRLLQFPRTLVQNPILDFALQRLASGKWWDRFGFYALWPIGKLQNAIFDLRDHFAAMVYIFGESNPIQPSQLQNLDWPGLISQFSASSGSAEETGDETLEWQLVPSGGDAGFVARVESAREWNDLELLLRTLDQIHAQSLFLSMPMDGRFFDKAGISCAARETYYEKLRMLAQRYHFALVEFEDHDGDADFLDHHRSHLSGKGWVFYDRALADFFSKTK